MYALLSSKETQSLIVPVIENDLHPGEVGAWVEGHTLTPLVISWN